MKYSQFKIFLLFIGCFLLFSCANTTQKNQEKKDIEKIISLKYAKGFSIEHYKDYIKLIIHTPYQNSTEKFEYFLSNPNQKGNSKTIKTPIKSVVVTSTTHIPMLELLQAETNLIGYPNTKFVSSKKTRKLIDSGLIKELGNEENINTELLLELQPDVVVGFSINSNSKMFNTIQKMNIPVLFNGDWLEETPLGRAEWIKFFGVLFDKEKEADSIFNSIEKNYLEAKQIALKSINRPTIISGGLFKDIWNLPAGGSFEAAFLKDANTNYIWKDSKGKGSLSYNIENVFEKGKDADIWLSPGFYKNLEELEKVNGVYSQFKAYKNNHIYSYSNKRGKTGGIIYFELSPIRPDLVLKDIIKIAHPELLSNYESTFFEKVE